MKRGVGILLVFAAVFAAAAAEKPLLATTIDFLDYAFGYKGPEGYYPLEAYEHDLKALAEGGIKKLYLRVNVCGLTHYPTKVSARYGDGDAFHWASPGPAKVLIETYKHYDPCKETIRIGRKYGMEVWAWESLFDQAGIAYPYPRGNPDWQAAWRRRGGMALLDPFFLDHPEAMAMRDPSLAPSRKEIERADREAAAKPVGKIVFTNDRVDLPASRIRTADDLQIFVSGNNIDYRKYTAPFRLKASVTDDGKNRLEITDLAISEPYVKLTHKPMPADNGFTLVLDRSRGQCEVFNTDGKRIPAVWGTVRRNYPHPENSPLNFEPYPTAWDYRSRQIGFKAGEVEGTSCFYGVPEFCVPAAMEHEVARFAELAAYPFDGFMFNTRCHSPAQHPEQYGFNPEVLAKFRERFGREYAGGEGDLGKLFAIRAEALAEYLKRCKAIAGGRPIYMSAPMPPEKKDDPDYNSTFGPMPWPYRQCFADGSLDGVIMIGRNFKNGKDFSSYFTREVTGGKPIRIGIFREMMNRPKGYDFAADLEAIRKAGLDEVELYESRVFNRNPILLEITRGRVPKEWNRDVKLVW